MRIALSNSSAHWGGVHTVNRLLAEGLLRRGHDVVVLCRPGKALEQELRGIVPLRPVLGGTDYGPASTARALAALRRHRSQVVVTMMDKDLRMTALAARALRIPVVARRANDRPLRSGLRHRALYGWLPDVHVANSHATRRTMLQSAPWMPPERVRVIYNGIPTDALAAAEPADLGLPPDALAVGFVGRLENRKGVRELLAAWPRVAASVPRAHLVVVGKGPLEDEVRRACADGPRATWLGYREKVGPVMKALDLLAVPSHWEGFGLVAAEALAAGTPVVASTASSLPEVVRDGIDGLLVPPRDADALAAALVELCTDAGRRARMAAAGPGGIRERFSWEGMLDGYERLLSGLC